MLFKGVFTNSAGILTSRVAGFVRDFTTASILGANVYSDIFFVAFKLPNLLRHIFAEGAFTQAFLPSFTAARYKGRFSAEIFLWLFGVILILSFAATFFAEILTLLMAWGFSEETRQMAAPFVALNFWYLDFIFVVTFLMALLHYRKHFAVSAFSTALLNLSMIIALLIAKDKEQIEIVWYLSFGVLAGGLLQVLVHIAALRGKRLIPMLVGGFKKKRDVSADTSRFRRSFFPAVFGASSIHLAAFIDTLLASFLAAGSISYLYYANRIFQLPLAIFAIAVSMALFPVIARAIKRGDENGAIALLSRNFWLLAFLLSASAVGGLLLSEGIIWLLFERGAFTREDTIVTGQALGMYLIGLIPFGLARIFSLWLYSNHRQMDAAKISAWALGGNIVFSLALIGPFGVLGLALAGSLSGFILLYLNLRAFGWQRFWGMIRAKFVFLLVLTLLIEAALIEGFKYLVEYRGFFA